jgi:hypothetical protein
MTDEVTTLKFFLTSKVKLKPSAFKTFNRPAPFKPFRLTSRLSPSARFQRFKTFQSFKILPGLTARQRLKGFIPTVHRSAFFSERRR